MTHHFLTPTAVAIKIMSKMTPVPEAIKIYCMLSEEKEKHTVFFGM